MRHINTLFGFGVCCEAWSQWAAYKSMPAKSFYQIALTFGTVRTQESSKAVAVSSHTLSVSITVC